MNRSLWRCVGVVALVFAAGLGALAEPCTITVQPGESIQAAIDAASPGDVICLAEGEWEENITITKDLRVQGAGAQETVIKGLEPGLPVTRIESDERIEVILAGLTAAKAKAGDPMSWEEHGICVRGEARVSVLCSVSRENKAAGIAVTDADYVVITGSTVEGNMWGGITIGDSTQVTITGLTAKGNEANGISVWGSTKATISASTVAGNSGFGITLGGSSQVKITQCTVEGNDWHGIGMADASQATIEDNVIRDTEGYAIMLWEVPCFEFALDADHDFTGRVIGKGNSGESNAEGDYCPEELAFLFTEEGGEFDRRE